MAGASDDKSDIVIPFILERLQHHRQNHNTPFFIGLNGVQGVGKTTLVNSLSQTLHDPPHSLRNITFSIDDLYLPFEAQNALASSHSQNPLVQHRGQPSTHDVQLGLSLFRSLKARERNVKIPSYDKSAHDGRGDRVDQNLWQVVNTTHSSGDKPEDDLKDTIEVVIFEGWCVGFRPLPHDEVTAKWRLACEAEQQRKAVGQPNIGRLGLQREEDVHFVNAALHEYDTLTDYLDAFVFLDAENTRFVYDWRLEQESKLREEKGKGMTDEQVVSFVDGYYPAYELFSDRLRQGVFGEEKGKQLRLVVGRDRKVLGSRII